MTDKKTDKLFKRAIVAVKANKGRNVVFSKQALGSKLPSPASLSGYSGNIRPYDLFEIQTRLAKFTERNTTTLKALQTKYLASGFTPTRFRFDLFNAAIRPSYDTGHGKDELANRLSEYADDHDIDKALAFIIARS